ncbi:OmpH family outer membrane protein [Arenicella sp. 4NH20-0111]|uniref:OmpH family outer membrane protein n=1 Tax=Arenicella sp. 4NH20-0111 TaxID=3127648 RepID=UPI003104B746
MFKKSLLLLVMIVSGAVANTASAQLKIGYFDNREVLQSLPSLQKEQQKLQAEFEPKEKEMNDLANELRKLQEDLQKNSGTVYTAEQVQAKQLEYQSKRQQLELKKGDYDRLRQARNNQTLSKIQTQIAEHVAKIAKDENYDLILHTGVFLASPKVDITQKILQSMSSK